MMLVDLMHTFITTPSLFAWRSFSFVVSSASHPHPNATYAERNDTKWCSQILCLNTTRVFKCTSLWAGHVKPAETAVSAGFTCPAQSDVHLKTRVVFKHKICEHHFVSFRSAYVALGCGWLADDTTKEKDLHANKDGVVIKVCIRSTSIISYPFIQHTLR